MSAAIRQGVFLCRYSRRKSGQIASYIRIDQIPLGFALDVSKNPINCGIAKMIGFIYRSLLWAPRDAKLRDQASRTDLGKLKVNRCGIASEPSSDSAIRSGRGLLRDVRRSVSHGLQETAQRLHPSLDTEAVSHQVSLCSIPADGQFYRHGIHQACSAVPTKTEYQVYAAFPAVSSSEFLGLIPTHPVRTLGTAPAWAGATPQTRCPPPARRPPEPDGKPKMASGFFLSSSWEAAAWLTRFLGNSAALRVLDVFPRGPSSVTDSSRALADSPRSFRAASLQW